MFSRIDLKERLRIPVMEGNRLSADHFRTDQTGSKLAAEQTKRQVCHSCHRRQYYRIFQLYRSDFHACSPRPFLTSALKTSL